MPIKKSELYSSLWSSCDELRGGMDASQYKDYWAETMQDDCYLIAADGWKAETYRIIERDKKGKVKDRGGTCDLVPRR